MAGIDISVAQARLDSLIAAHDAVSTGQEYEIAGRRLKRANLSDIQAGIEYWDRKVKELSAAATRRRAIVPRPSF